MTTDAQRKTPAPSNTVGRVNDGDLAEAINTEVTKLWARAADWLTITSGTDDIIATADATLIAAYNKNNSFWIVPTNTTVGSVTINVDGKGVVAITDYKANALQGGEMVAAGLYLIVFDGTQFRLMSGGSGQGGGASAPDLIIREEQSTGVNGGGASSGSWFTRVLNTTVRNNLPGSLFSSNIITLQAGTYYIEWEAPNFDCNGFQSRLFNVSDNSVVEYGNSQYSGGANNTFSSGQTVVTITSAKQFRIESKVQSTEAGNGCGQANGQGTKEIYSSLRAWKYGSLPASVTGANGGGISMPYTFSTTTTDADPGNGFVRLNNATENTATVAYISTHDNTLINTQTVLDALDDSTSQVRGFLRVQKVGDQTKWIVFSTAAITTATNYRKLALTIIGASAASPFANGDNVILEFTRNGDRGFGGAFYAPYVFDTTTTDSDPGNGVLRLDNGTQNAATTIRVDLLDNLGLTRTAQLDTVDGSNSLIKGHILLVNTNDETKFILFAVTGRATPSGYRNISCTVVNSSGSTPFALNDVLNLVYTRAGDVGASNGADYTFSTTTTDSDPGNGTLRLSAGTQNTSTVLRFDLLDINGVDVSAFLATFAASTGTVKGTIKLVKKNDPTKWLTFDVSALASPSGYKNVTVVNVASSTASPFANGDVITALFTRAGDKGDPGAAGLPGMLGNLIPPALGTIFTSMTRADGNIATANLFDGITAQSNGGVGAASAMFVNASNTWKHGGLNFPGLKFACAFVRLWPSTDQGFTGFVSAGFTVQIWGKVSGIPSVSGDGVLLGSASFSDGFSSIDIQCASPFDYYESIWVDVICFNSSDHLWLSEMQIFGYQLQTAAQTPYTSAANLMTQTNVKDALDRLAWSSRLFVGMTIETNISTATTNRVYRGLCAEQTIRIENPNSHYDMDIASVGMAGVDVSITGYSGPLFLYHFRLTNGTYGAIWSRSVTFTGTSGSVPNDGTNLFAGVKVPAGGWTINACIQDTFACVCFNGAWPSFHINDWGYARGAVYADRQTHDNTLAVDTIYDVLLSGNAGPAYANAVSFGVFGPTAVIPGAPAAGIAVMPYSARSIMLSGELISNGVDADAYLIQPGLSTAVRRIASVKSTQTRTVIQPFPWRCDSVGGTQYFITNTTARLRLRAEQWRNSDS